MVVDPMELERVGGTDAGGYFALAEDILLARPHKGYVQTEDGARASLRELHRLARVRGRRQVVVVLLDKVRSQDPGARKVWRDEIDPRLVCGVGLVGASLLGRAIGSFFLGLSRLGVRTTMHADLDAAARWAEQLLRDSGGALDE